MIRYLLCILLHLSFVHASEWRQCWGTEYLYYDEACCDAQDQLSDAQFHCLNDMPQLANYTDLKETLHEQLDSLNTCVNGEIVTTANSYAHVVDDEKCTSPLLNTNSIFSNAGDSSTGVTMTIELCASWTYYVLENDGYCKSDANSNPYIGAIHTSANCPPDFTWKDGSSATGLFEYHTSANWCGVCGTDAKTAVNGEGQKVYQATLGSTSDTAPTCSSNETFVDLVTEVRLVQENMNNLATDAVETLQPKSTRLSDLSRGKFNDLTLSNGTLILNNLNASSITIDDVSIGTLDVGFLEVSNLHGDLDLESHAASNVNFEVLTLDGVDVITAPEIISNMNGLSSTLNASDIALLNSLNGTTVAGKVVIMGTDRLTLDTITIEGTLHMPAGTLTAGLNVLKGVSGINASDFSALSNALTNLNVNTVTTNKVKMISRYDPSTIAYAGTACSTPMECQVACDNDASCSGYSNLISCTDPNKLIEVDCINSCEDGGLIENECGNCTGDASKGSESTCLSSCNIANLTETQCVNLWTEDDNVTHYESSTNQGVTSCTEATDAERLECCKTFAVSLEPAEAWSIFMYSVASGFSYCNVFAPSDAPTLKRTGTDQGIYSTLTYRKWTNRVWDAAVFTERSWDATTTYAYGANATVDVDSSFKKMEATKFAINECSDASRSVADCVVTSYAAGNTSYAGTACADVSACEVACTADSSCEGYTQLFECSDAIMTTEATCVDTCSDSSIDSSTACITTQNGYLAAAATAHTTPDTSDTAAWPEFTCGASQTSGTFRLVNSCTLTDEIALNGELTIVGQTEDMSNLVTITAATGKRHFKLSGATHKLNLWYVKLTGADISNENSPNDRGGSVFIDSNGGELKLYYSEISGNKAKIGGGIRAYGSSNRNALINIYNSIIKSNEATQNTGGGLYLALSVLVIEDTVIDSNTGNYGAGMRVENCVTTITNSKISNNNAIDGGGIYANNNDMSLTIRESTFTSNTASGAASAIYVSDSGTITLVNTVIPSNGIDMLGTPTWNTCSNSPCTEAPHTGACSAVDSSDDKLGVVCATTRTWTTRTSTTTYAYGPANATGTGFTKSVANTVEAVQVLSGASDFDKLKNVT